MESCPCSIFDVREEQILETNGTLCIRLICNVCGSVLDSKLISETQKPAAGLRDRDDEGLAVEATSS